MIPNCNKVVLVVDDEASIRSLMVDALAHAGYEVQSAESGLVALCEIERQVPDILLSDLNMPGMSGIELLAEVRRRFPTIRVVAMSGAYCGDDVPAEVLADAFHEKTRGLGCLLRVLADSGNRGQSSDKSNRRRIAKP